MKKKLFNLFAICLCAIAFLASCGGPKDATKELEISNAEVLGDSADVVTIVDGTYTLVGVVPTDITQTLSIKIKLRLERPIQDKDLHISGWNLEILDKNGTSLLDKLILKDSEDSKLLKFVTEGKEGEEKEFTFQYSIANGDLYKKIMNDAANINLKDVSFYKEQYYSSECLKLLMKKLLIQIVTPTLNLMTFQVTMLTRFSKLIANTLTNTSSL